MAVSLKAILFSLFALASCACLNSAQAQGTLRECAALRADSERLACYDSLAKSLDATDTQASQRQPETQPEDLIARHEISRPMTGGSLLGRAWQLDPGSKTGTFAIASYRPMYVLLAQHTNAINTMPSSPAPGRSAMSPTNSPTNYDATEAKFQISAKTKAWQNIVGSDVDLWLAYTQQSNWQLYNSSGSAPFRNTDYEPELILTLPINRDLLGMSWRMVNFGFSHQSNGRANPLSRSWNRLYARVGVERGNFTLMARPWWRVLEASSRDDNPDIGKYMGNGDVLTVYRTGEHVVSALARYSFSGHRGGFEADWAFPISGPLKGYVRTFNGYGENLIDYNHRQTTLGIGVAISTW